MTHPFYIVLELVDELSRRNNVLKGYLELPPNKCQTRKEATRRK